MPCGWSAWEPAVAHNVVGRTRAHAWHPGLGDVSLAGPGPQYEAFVGRAHHVSPHHKLRGTRRHLGERA